MSERWDLYDENRRRTGQTVERGRPIPHDCYHLVVSVWLVNSDGQILLSQRHPAKSYPLRWECTGGCVVAGEDSLTGALREVQEELGIALWGADAQLLSQTRRDALQDFYDVWLFRTDVPTERLVLQQTEVVAAKWVDPAQLLTMWEAGELHPLLDDLTPLLCAVQPQA